MLKTTTAGQILDEMQSGTLKPYNSAAVNALKMELDFVQQKIEEIKREAEQNSITEELSINFAIHKAYRDRNERILRAYAFFRSKIITWNYFAKSDIKGCLSAAEVEFKNDVHEALDTYLAPYSDLNFFNNEPPLDFYVQVVTLEDCGLVLCGDDFIDLRKDRLYFLRKSDISHLISANLAKILQ